MIIRREEVLQIIDQLPDEIDIEELIYRLYLLEKLRAAEADMAAGRMVSAEEMRAEAMKWRR